MKKLRNRKSQRSNNAQSRKRKTKPAVPPEFLAAYASSYLEHLILDATRILAGHYSSADATRDIRRLKSRMLKEGLSFATKTLPCLVTGLLNLYEGHDASFPQFKLMRGMEYPRFLNGLFRLALESTDPELKGRAFDILYSFSTAFKKYKAPYSKNVLLKQFKDFVNTDQELADLNLFEESVFSILERARNHIATWLAEVNLGDVKRFLPRPGPGATNTPTEKTERYRPRVLYKQINDVLDYQEWWYPTLWDACLRSREFLLLHKNSRNEPVARFKFVPKTMDKPRGICIEENEMQVMQQAVRVYLYDLLKDHYPNIALSEQNVNAQLALRSSVDLEDATIDMSEASDRISRELVSWLFQDNAMFHDVLMALSTKWIKPPQELSTEYPDLLRANKFAPMGSALCFPIMTLVHYALVLAIIEHNTYSNKNMQDLLSRVHVYGDDIVLPSETAEDVFYWLPKFGMKLNKTKSFVHSHFRESCGIHALHGQDVTPVYLKYIPYHNNGAAVAAAYATEKQLFTKGFYSTAEFQRRVISEQYKYNEIVPDGSAQAGFSRCFRSAYNSRLTRYKISRRRKWNSNLQCWMYHTNTIGKQTENKIITDDLSAYLRWLWLHTKNEGPPGSPFGESVIGDSHGDLIIRQRRVPESALLEEQVNGIVERAVLRYPTGRISLRRDSIVHHKVVLRQCGGLQQQGASEGCVFC